MGVEQKRTFTQMSLFSEMRKRGRRHVVTNTAFCKTFQMFLVHSSVFYQISFLQKVAVEPFCSSGQKPPCNFQPEVIYIQIISISSCTTVSHEFRTISFHSTVHAFQRVHKLLLRLKKKTQIANSNSKVGQQAVICSNNAT